jgi:hypothetical protein
VRGSHRNGSSHGRGRFGYVSRSVHSWRDDPSVAASDTSSCRGLDGRHARRAHERQRWFRGGQRWRVDCEGRISVKLRHGLRRCRYRGADGTARWVSLGVIATNLRSDAGGEKMAANASVSGRHRVGACPTRPCLTPSQLMAKVGLKAWARVGAEARVRELTTELPQIYSVVPDLKSVGKVSRPAETKGSRKRAGMRAPVGKWASPPLRK